MQQSCYIYIVNYTNIYTAYKDSIKGITSNKIALRIL